MAKQQTSFIGKLVEDVVLDLMSAFMFMIALGVAHSTDHRVPTIGYWTAFWLLWVLSIPVSVTLHAYKRWNANAWRS
jgi:hypothetical protein